MKDKTKDILFNEYVIFVILALIIFGINYVFIKIDKNNCEKNGGVYIWSFNEYETKCHIKGE